MPRPEDDYTKCCQWIALHGTQWKARIKNASVAAVLFRKNEFNTRQWKEAFVQQAADSGIAITLKPNAIIATPVFTSVRVPCHLCGQVFGTKN